MNEVDTEFMREALRLARRGLGRTSPNPAVGALIVKGGKVIASGYHRMAGAPHAEVEALNGVKGSAAGCTLYVTLEPCNHYGRTPPCTEAILKSRIKRVVVGMRDPNPNVSGGGCKALSDEGIEVKTGVLEADCRRLNESYIKFVTSGRPFVILKSAMTMDGWTATHKGYSKWITNDRSRRFVHGLRNGADAVMVGVGTVVADDPKLTVRLKNGHKERGPLRIVLDTHLRTPQQAQILKPESHAETLIVVGPEVASDRVREYEKPGVSTMVCPVKTGRIDLQAMLDILGKLSIVRLLVEGGATLVGSMVRERLIDQFYFFLAPRVLGGEGTPMASGPGPEKLEDGLRLKDLRVMRFSDDLLIIAYPDYGKET